MGCTRTSIWKQSVSDGNRIRRIKLNTQTHAVNYTATPASFIFTFNVVKASHLKFIYKPARTSGQIQLQT